MNQSLTTPKNILPTHPESPKRIILTQDNPTKDLLKTPTDTEAIEELRLIANAGIQEIKRRFNKSPTAINPNDIKMLNDLANAYKTIISLRKANEGEEDLSSLSDDQLKQMAQEFMRGK